MSIIYHHSLSLPDLASVLQDAIRTEQAKAPLQSPLIVIPNLNIERWLKINLPLLSPDKISLNLRFVFLEKILEELVYTGDRAENPLRLYSHSETEKLIFQYLMENKDSPQFQFLGKYLQSPNRVFYLSGKLANYFKDYELNRSTWISSWASEHGIEIPSKLQIKISTPLANNAYYLMEKKIYSDLFLDPSKSETTLSQYLLRYAHTLPSLEGTHLHLFCLANLSDTYLQVLQTLSTHSKLGIHFYQFHTGDTDQRQDETSLSRWSYPQCFLANSLSRFTKLSQADSKVQKKENPYPVGLQALRNHLQGKEGTNATSLLEGFGSTEDASVRIWNAPSAYREVEAVANDIIYKMNQARERKEDLSLLDFSLLLTDVKSYRSAIEWVFDGGILIETSNLNHLKPERQKIPYSLVDLKASDASPLFRAMQDFWEICNPTGFKYAELQKLLRNPLINHYLSEDESALAEFENILFQLGVAYEDFELQTINDPFQISNGIRRAVLSSVFSEVAATEQMKFAHLNIDDDTRIIQLTDLWFRISHSRSLVSEFLKLGRWEEESLRRLRIGLESLLQLDADDLENRNLFHKFWTQLSSWDGIEIPEKDGLELLKLISLQAFDDISVKKGDYLTGGVTISLLQPMRPLPFKHVYILGLGEGKFPSPNDNSRLNLRNESPEDWDLSKKQIQESLLWESLFSAYESITLSYVGKNTKEDKIFEPCSSLYEIMHGLQIPSATEIPLVAYSKAYNQNENARRAGLVSYDYSHSLVRDPHFLPTAMDEFQNPESLTFTTEKTIGKVKIHLTELMQFAKDPLDTYLKKKLGMYISEDVDQAKEEIFHLDSLQRSVLQKKVYLNLLENLTNQNQKWDRQQIETILNPIIENEIQYGRFPNRVYTKLEKENILNHFEDRKELFANWSQLLQGAKYHRYVSFGNTGLSADTCLKLPALVFASLPNYVLQHECEHVFELNGIYYLIYTKRLESDVEENTEYNHYKDYFGNMIGPFLHWIAFAKSGLPLKILPTNMKTKSGTLHGSLQFKSEKNQADQYLESLLQAFTSDKPTFFPRILYLNFFYETFAKSKSEPFRTGILSEKEDLWDQYQYEEIDTLYNHLTSISKLYPNTRDFLFNSNIDFAEKFYAPISLWRQE